MSTVKGPEAKAAKALKKISKKEIKDTLLVEIAWEVLNQVGGIYTVIRSKVPATMPKWGDNYCLLGPYFKHQVSAEFDPIDDFSDPFGKAVLKMREKGFEVHYGHWLVTGRPKAVLFNLGSIWNKLGEIKYLLWEHHGITTPAEDHLIDQVVAFGECVKIFLDELSLGVAKKKKIIAHFHEWMAASCIPDIRRQKMPISTVFTTHATLLGRYLAMNSSDFYQHLPFMDWSKEATNFNVDAIANLERAAAHGAQVFTTVSDVTAQECKYLLGRTPDVILPNGINNQRFEALHEFQNLHREYKEKIHQFAMAHFFKSYTFDLDNTLYFFTSGRYEYKNKGFDLALEALARLNWRLKNEGSEMTVVMFFITKQPFHSINPDILHSRAVLEELRQTTDAIKKQVGERLFYSAASSSDHRLPMLNDFVDDYWRLRYRRLLQSWKTDQLPPVVTHNLVDDGGDDILNFLRTSSLLNHEDDRVKIVYHPDFVNSTNPLFGMEYGQFVRGCHMGVFPSYYEPWGYTPLECIASGVPAITSDLAGFGDYVLHNMKDHASNGIYVVNRQKRNFNQSADQLAYQMYKFINMNRRERITLRNKVESTSVYFDWTTLTKYYDQAYQLALDRLKA
jgi:glycogen synthase